MIFLAFIFSNIFAEEFRFLPHQNEKTSMALSKEVDDKELICTKKGVSPTEIEEFASYPKIKNWKNCAMICSIFENCKAWSHTKVENVCRLFSNFKYFEENKLVLTGIKNCNETMTSETTVENRQGHVKVAVEVFNAIVNSLKNDAGRTIALPSGQRFMLKTNCWQDGKGSCPRANCFDNKGPKGIPVIHTDIGCKWWCLRGGACAQQICCPPENEISEGCPNGWKKFHLTGKCYKMIIEWQLRTFWDAADNCKKLAQSFGSTTGVLASVPSWIANNFIESLDPIPRWKWIGGYRKVENQNVFEWLDGTPWSYTKWETGYPKNTGGNCILSGKGKWLDWPCDGEHGRSFSVCQMDPI